MPHHYLLSNVMKSSYFLYIVAEGDGFHNIFGDILFFFISFFNLDKVAVVIFDGARRRVCPFVLVFFAPEPLVDFFSEKILQIFIIIEIDILNMFDFIGEVENGDVFDEDGIIILGLIFVIDNVVY